MSFKGPPFIPVNKVTGKKDNGTIDVVFQLWRCGLVHDGSLVSKTDRNYLVKHGFAVSYDGVQALTGKGKMAFLTSPTIWRRVFFYWFEYKRNPFIASAGEIKRSLN